MASSSKPLSSTAKEYFPSAAVSPKVVYFTPPLPTSATPFIKHYFPTQPYYYYPSTTTPTCFMSPYYFMKAPPLSNASLFSGERVNSDPVSGYVRKDNDYTKTNTISSGLKFSNRRSSTGTRKLWLPKGNHRHSPVVSVPRKTTLMIRNIPNQIRRQELIEFLERRCWQQESDSDVEVEFDFLYLPMDFMMHRNLGYAFVNFTSEAAAGRMMKTLNNWKWTPTYQTTKVCKIDWARIQGKDALVKRFANTFFNCVDSEYLPVVLCNANSEMKEFVTVGRCVDASKLRVRVLRDNCRNRAARV